MADEKHKYPQQLHKQNPFWAMIHITKKGKIAAKSGFLGPKSGYLEFKKYRMAANLERLNGAKYRFCS